MYTNLKIFSGNSNTRLSKEICTYLGIELSKAKVAKFADGECRIKIYENARGADAFVVQSTSKPVNHNVMELLIMIDALKRASARRITAVIPYFGYARQDRKDSPRVPITAKLVADLLQSAGAKRVLLMDIHSAQIQGFFDCPVDNLLALPVLVEYIKSKKLKNLTIVSPDTGGVVRAKELAKRLRAKLVIVDKRRPAPNVAKVYNVIGTVKDKNAVIIDDMVDTAGTLAEVSDALKKAGAKKVYAACSHGIFSGDAIEKIKKSCIVEMITTDTITRKRTQPKKLKTLSVAPLLGEAIKRIHQESSVSDLFI